MLELSVRKPDWQKAIAELQIETSEKIRLVLEAVGLEVIAWLKSYTDQMRPPARIGKGWTGPRPAHPGGWADVTHVLVNSYSPPQVSQVANGWRLTLANTAEYAIHLEARHGFFVLTGVTDPGGPIDQALAEVIPRIAPGWTFRHGA